jgi:hypothetical protein
MSGLLDNPTPKPGNTGKNPLQEAFDEGHYQVSNYTLMVMMRKMTAEMANMAATMNTIMVANASMKDQNARLEQRTNRIEQHLQALKRQHNSEPPATSPTPAQNNPSPRDKTPAPRGRKQPTVTATTQAPPQATNAEKPNTKETWATVVNKKKTPETGPTKRTERTIIIHRNAENRDEKMDIFEMRKTINMYLMKAKAPTGLRIAGIQWNRRGNLTLTTTEGFTEEELNKHQATIEEQVRKFDKEITSISKQETWTKLIVHGVDLTQFPDTEIGMTDLRMELETFNEGLKLASNPRYLTHPDKRINKEHSSCVIALKDKDKAKIHLKHGLTIFGQQRKTAEYFSARPADQCNKCQGFGHHWQRCTAEPKCGICASAFHETRSHICTNCNSKTPCDHMPAKCANCKGPHKANSMECETLKAIRNPKPDRLDEQL